MNRVSERNIVTATPFVTTYSYHRGASAWLTTPLVKQMQVGNKLYEYGYDELGNITDIELNGVEIERYTYDEWGQVLKSNDIIYYLIQPPDLVSYLQFL